jgi:hypothetical protein
LQLLAAEFKIGQLIWSADRNSKSTRGNNVSRHKEDQPARNYPATDARKSSWLPITQKLKSQPAAVGVSLAFNRHALYLSSLLD